MHKTRNIGRPVGFGEKEMEGYFMLSNQDVAIAIANKLTGTQLRLWFYLKIIEKSADRVTQEKPTYRLLLNSDEIAAKIGSHADTVEKDLRILKKYGLIQQWLSLGKASPASSVERQIRDSLQEELGGLVEVITPAGRVDLLTNSEIIEIKNIKAWKAALGQILAYSSFYPQHQKRLHLFGTAKELKALTDIEATCLSFDIQVTGEEVKE